MDQEIQRHVRNLREAGDRSAPEILLAAMRAHGVQSAAPRIARNAAMPDPAGLARSTGDPNVSGLQQGIRVARAGESDLPALHEGPAHGDCTGQTGADSRQCQAPVSRCG